MQKKVTEKKGYKKEKPIYYTITINSVIQESDLNHKLHLVRTN